VRRAPVEASALPASVGLARARVGLGVSLLRLRSDEQLVSLFRAGNEEAFRVIHDRYRSRMHAYARQMLSSASADAEDVVQEIFVRAYAGLRSNRRDLALRAWLYRIAHNRCIDELRRPQAIAVEAVDELGESTHADPHLRAEQREALRRLIADVQRLPDQQRSALLMRELGGMPYADVSGALGVSVPAVKSLLVRARVGLVAASEARDIDCSAIRDDLIVAHDRGVRASGRARRHMRDCSECRRFRKEVHGVSRRFALLLPALGPLGITAKLLGIGSLGGGSAAAGSSTGAAAGSTAAAAGTTTVAAGSTAAAAGSTGVAAGSTAAVAGGGAVVAGGGAVVAGGGALAAAGTGHVVTIIAATVVAAGSAIGIQQVSSPPHHPAARMARASIPTPSHSAPRSTAVAATTSASHTAAGAAGARPMAAPAGGSTPSGPTAAQSSHAVQRTPGGATVRGPRGGFTAGTSSASTATATGRATTTVSPTTTTTTPPTTTTSGTATAPTSTTPITTGPTSTVPTTATATDTPGPGVPTSTATTPGSSPPISTSAATTAAQTGRTGGSSLVPLRQTHSGGGPLRGRHRAGLGGGATASR
jgi:RNA polymerase sigma factor (sigma-70 family)